MMNAKEFESIVHGRWSDHSAQFEGCHICQRIQPLFWHTVSRTVVDSALCQRAGGEGIWVCALCDEALHRLIRKNPRTPEGSRQAVEVLLNRLSDRILQPARKYSKR